MKKSVIAVTLAAALSVAVSADAENYIRKGLQWHTTTDWVNHEDGTSGTDTYEYAIDRDTVIDGENCLLASVTATSLDRKVPYLYSILRVDGEKVYAFDKREESGVWRLIYDFGLTLQHNSALVYENGPFDGKYSFVEQPVRLDEISKVPAFPNLERMLIQNMSSYNPETGVSSGETGIPDVWIRGLGSENGVLHNVKTDVGGRLGYPVMDWAKLDGQTIYDRNKAGLESIKTSGNIKVTASGGAVTISGDISGKECWAYSVDGKLLFKTGPVNGHVTVPTAYKGMIIVHVGDLTVKTIL